MGGGEGINGDRMSEGKGEGEKRWESQKGQRGGRRGKAGDFS